MLKSKTGIVEDFLVLYGSPQNENNMSKSCIINRGNIFKVVWDIFVLIILLVVSMIIPIRLAFSIFETTTMHWLYTTIDLIFAIDLVLTFFTSITDEHKVYEITNKKIIAKQYLKGWFWVDLISIIPVDLILVSVESSATVLARFARIGKLHKLIRMVRLAKVFKLLKSKNTVVSQFASQMKISQSVERLMFFAVFFILFFHISACLFIFIG